VYQFVAKPLILLPSQGWLPIFLSNNKGSGERTVTVITESNGANSGDILSFFSGTLTLTSFDSTRFTLFKDNRTVTVTGSGFTYDSSGLTGGTINGVSMNYGGGNSATQTWSSLSVSGAAAWNALATGNITNFANLFLGGDDTFNVSGTATSTPGGPGYGGDDTYNFNTKLSGTVYLDGGAGNDTVNFNAGYDGGAFTNVVGSKGANLQFSNIENINLAAGSDYYFIPSATASGTTLTVNGSALGAANKLIFDATASGYSYLGSFVLLGGSGDDYLTSGQGNDTLNGGTGKDTASFIRATSGVTVNLSLSGPQAVGGGLGTDTLIGIENLMGSSSNDTLSGDGGDNVFDGVQGSDTFNGGGGNDTVTYATLGLLGSSVNASLAANIGGIFSSIENLTGTSRDDTLEGDAGNNVLDGGAGTDTVSYAHAASGVSINFAQPTVWATGSGTGTDTLISIEKVSGSAYDDSFIASAANAASLANNNLYKFNGTDYFKGNGGSDALDWHNLNGGVVYNSGDIQHVIGTSFSDYLASNLDNLMLEGGDGNDTLIGAPASSDSATSLLGGAGDDDLTLTALDASDHIDGGSGYDTLRVNSITGGTIVLGDTTLTSVESITLGTSNAVIKTSDATVAAGSSLAVTVAFNSSYTFDGSAEADGYFVLTALSSSTLTGGAGNDTFILKGGDDHLDGGGGFNTVDFSNEGPVTLDLSYTGLQYFYFSDYLTVANIQGVIGSAGDDRLTAASSNSYLSAGIGNDTLVSGAGSDYLDGGAGFDLVSYRTATGGITVDLSITSAQNTGGSGSDTLLGIEAIYGSDYGDTLRGDGTHSVYLAGFDGNDMLYSGAGDDTLFGGNGFNFVNYSTAAAGVTIDLSRASRRTLAAPAQTPWPISRGLSVLLSTTRCRQPPTTPICRAGPVTTPWSATAEMTISTAVLASTLPAILLPPAV